MMNKILATLMTYSISFQLILGGIPVALLSSNPALANSSCAEGLEWNAILNRCLTSRQAAQVQSASSRCQKISDKASQNKCYADALQAQVVDGENKGDIKGAGKIDTNKLSIILAMATLISSVTTLKYLKTGCKAATSAWLMAGASVSVFAGEVMSGLKFQKKSKEAFDDFQKILNAQNETEGSEVQSEALSAMIKREQAVIDAASTKKTFYTIAMAAYAAAGVMSLIEAIKYKVLLSTPGGQAGAKEFICVEAKSAEAEQAALNSTAQEATTEAAREAAMEATFEGSVSSVGLFGTGVTGSMAGAGGMGMGAMAGLLGGGAIASSALLSKMTTGGVKNLKTSPEPSGNENCNRQPCQGKIESQGEILEYLDSYFKKNQRVSFNKYYDSSIIDTITSWSSFYQLTSELKRYRAGEIESSSIQDFQNTKLAVEVLDIKSSEEEFGIMKLAIKITQQFGIQQTYASDVLKGFMMILGMGGIGFAAAKFLIAKSAGLTSMFIMPETRATLSGIMTAVALNQRSHMDKEKKKAEERKAFIEKLQLQVETAGNSFGSCTQEQRNSDMSKPHCYCYLQGGSINTARVKSATCKTFFGSGLANSLNKPTATSSAREGTSCTTPNATVIDESCSCRKTNTCTSVPKTGFTSTGVGPAAIANMSDVLDGLNNGSIRAAEINPELMVARAAALGKKQQALLNNPKNKSLLNDIKKSDARGQAAMRALAGQIASNPGLMNSNMGSMGSGSIGSGSPQEELIKLKEEFKKDMKQYEPGTIGGGSGSKLGAAGDDFSLDAITGGVTIEDEKLAEVMDTNFESTGSDINSNSDANIFQILTYRYQRSAMRRLFGGEAMLPADKASETEISE